MQRRLLLLGARHALPCKDLVLAAGKPEFARSISFSSALRKDQNEGKSGWLPQWLQSKLPSALGGTREYDELEELTFDAYAEYLQRARKLGGLTGFSYGTSRAGDPAAQGSLRLYEDIIREMRPEEKSDLSLFNADARYRVAVAVGCSMSQVDDCVAKFLWMKGLTEKLARMKREGKPLPTSPEQVEGELGSWRQFKKERGALGEGPIVPYDQRGPNGRPCPLAGTEAGRNTKCSLTRKAFKSCCGKRLLK